MREPAKYEDCSIRLHFDAANYVIGGKALLGEMINCPDCKEPFIPTPRKPEPASEEAQRQIGLGGPEHPAKVSPVSPIAPRTTSATPPYGAAERAAKIRRQAQSFTSLAILLLFIGLIIGFASLFNLLADEGVGKGFIVAASFITVSLWLYLIGQIIHIRANTEK